MARTDTVSSVIARITGDIKNQTFAHVYVLTGDEAYLRDQFKNNLKNALMPENPSMNFTVYSGKKTDPKSLIQMADTLPFLADHRLIMIEESGFFKSADDHIIDLIGALPEEAYLIFDEDVVDKRGRMYKAAVKAGYVAEFTTPDDGMLRRWLVQTASKAGHLMKDATAYGMLQWCGHDMFRLYHEMEKLISYCDLGAEITDTAIREVCSRELKDTIFQLTAAIAQRQREAAFKAYRDLVGLETKPSQILYMLRREFKLVWMVKALTSQGQSPSEISRKARIHPAFINRYMNVQAAFDEAQLLSVTDELTEIQALTHTGRADARFALESFMMKHTDE